MEIKIYRYPINEAITRLLKLVEELQTISKGNLASSIIPSVETTTGDFVPYLLVKNH